MAYIWGANTPEEAVHRFAHLEVTTGPDDSAEDRANFDFFQLAKSILGRRPTATEFAGAYTANQSGQGLQYLTYVKQQLDATTAADAAKAAEEAARNTTYPTLAPGNPPYMPVSSASPVPGDGASGLLMPATANAYTPSYIAPAGGVPAPPSISIEKNDKSFLIIAALAVGGFFLLKKWI